MITDFFGTDVRFEDPWVLALLGAILAAFALNVRRERGGAGALLFSSVGLLPRTAPSWRLRLRWVLLPLRIVALVLFALALARPQVAFATYALPAQGIDIAIAIDVSSSMTMQDFGGRRRIDAVKNVVRGFIGGLKNDRVGIVIFAGETLTLGPMSLDYTATQRVAEKIEAGTLIRDGTAIGHGLAAALNLLRDSQAKSKIVILLTDGENNLGTISPLDAAQMARVLGVRVYTIGAVGATNSVDELLLKRMSNLTDGTYYRASDQEALLDIYREIAQLEKSRVGARGFTTFADVYAIFLVPAFALLALELVLGLTLLRRSP